MDLCWCLFFCFSFFGKRKQPAGTPILAWRSLCISRYSSSVLILLCVKRKARHQCSQLKHILYPKDWLYSINMFMLFKLQIWLYPFSCLSLFLYVGQCCSNALSHPLCLYSLSQERRERKMNCIWAIICHSLWGKYMMWCKMCLNLLHLSLSTLKQRRMHYARSRFLHSTGSNLIWLHSVCFVIWKSAFTTHPSSFNQLNTHAINQKQTTTNSIKYLFVNPFNLSKCSCFNMLNQIFFAQPDLLCTLYRSLNK